MHVCSVEETPSEASPGTGSQGRPFTLMSARWMVMPALPYLPAVLKRFGEDGGVRSAWLPLQGTEQELSLC